MPTHRRQEPFRYEFPVPHDASFYISRFKDKEHRSKTGKGVLLDISLGGLRLKTSFDLPEKCELTFDFVIAEKPLRPIGEIVWKRQQGRYFLYGVDFVDEDQKPELLQALKLNAKL